MAKAEQKVENAVVPWNEELAKFAEAAAAVEKPSMPLLSFRNGVMKYQDTVIPGNTLDVVVVASVFENAYYKGPFDAQNPRAPVCFAISEVEDELDPHENSSEKQSESCFGCPKLEWKSAANGGRGKACKEIRRLALIAAADLESPERIAKAEIVLAKLPVTSVKNWSNYVNQLSATVRRPPFAVITNMRCEINPTTQFKVMFAPRSNLAEEAARAIYGRRTEALRMLTSPYDPASDEPPPPTSNKY